MHITLMRIHMTATLLLLHISAEDSLRCFKIMRLLILNAVPLCYGQIDYKIGITRNVVQEKTVYTTTR